MVDAHCKFVAGINNIFLYTDCYNDVRKHWLLPTLHISGLLGRLKRFREKTLKNNVRTNFLSILKHLVRHHERSYDY